MKQQTTALELKSGGTLVIIDMQAPFIRHCTNQQFIAAVVDQVKLAISRGWGIVIVEVKPWAYGPTIKPIMELLEGQYHSFKIVQKEGDDGSQHVLEVCQATQLPDQFFRVTGVLIGACVKSTAWGLCTRKHDCFVRVIKEACATNGDTAAAWAAFKEGPRVAVSSNSIDIKPNPILQQIKLKITSLFSLLMETLYETFK
jgi:nicotinamidase-related amidase